MEWRGFFNGRRSWESRTSPTPPLRLFQCLILVWVTLYTSLTFLTQAGIFIFIPPSFDSKYCKQKGKKMVFERFSHSFSSTEVNIFSLSLSLWFTVEAWRLRVISEKGSWFSRFPSRPWWLTKVCLKMRSYLFLLESTPLSPLLRFFMAKFFLDFVWLLRKCGTSGENKRTPSNWA